MEPVILQKSWAGLQNATDISKNDFTIAFHMYILLVFRNSLWVTKIVFGSFPEAEACS